jgi:hypothetical protein
MAQKEITTTIKEAMKGSVDALSLPLFRLLICATALGWLREATAATVTTTRNGHAAK